MPIIFGFVLDKKRGSVAFVVGSARTGTRRDSGRARTRTRRDGSPRGTARTVDSGPRKPRATLTLPDSGCPRFGSGGEERDGGVARGGGSSSPSEEPLTKGQIKSESSSLSSSSAFFAEAKGIQIFAATVSPAHPELDSSSWSTKFRALSIAARFFACRLCSRRRRFFSRYFAAFVSCFCFHYSRSSAFSSVGPSSALLEDSS